MTGNLVDQSLRPAGLSAQAFEAMLERELAAFLQAEYAVQGENFHQWYRYKFIPQNVGLAPYDWAIANFVIARRSRFGRFVEIGAGIGQQSILLATRGFRVWMIESYEPYVELGRRAIARITERLSPALPEFITQVYDWFPIRAAEYVTPDALLCFPTLSATTTAEQFTQMLDSIAVAKGVILSLRNFMDLRETKEEEELLIGQLHERGFAAPIDIHSWTEPETAFHSHKVVFFEKEPS